MPAETIRAGKYTFSVDENKLVYADRIISHTFKIGGSYNDCISISYTYNNNIPVSAKINFVQYEPECAIENNLEKGGGTAIMLKSILRHVYKKIPQVTAFTFEDMSHIDCVEKDLTKQPPRKPQRPLSLAYLSIAYNSSTWYEKYFDAEMTDATKYEEYRTAVKFLTNPKDKIDFISFLQVAKPPEGQIEYLKGLYEKVSTYRAFFEAIPFDDRCELLRPWLKTFIESSLGNKYSPYNWKINVLSPKIQNSMMGGAKRRRGGGTVKRKNRENFPPTYGIIMYNEIHSM